MADLGSDVIKVERPDGGDFSRAYDQDFHGLSAYFFFNDTANTKIYTLSLHDALPISMRKDSRANAPRPRYGLRRQDPDPSEPDRRSEEHTSELQSRVDIVCRLLL